MEMLSSLATATDNINVYTSVKQPILGLMNSADWTHGLDSQIGLADWTRGLDWASFEILHTHTNSP